MKMVQWSQGARISSGPSVAISSPLRKFLEADQRAHEAERLGLDHAGLQQLEAPLRTRRRRRRIAPDEAEVRQEVQRHFHGQVGRRAQEVLAAFGHQRHAAAGRFAVPAVLDHRRAAAQALGHDQVHVGPADGQRRCRIALEVGVDPERLHRLRRGVQVQDVVGRRHRRPHRAGPAQLRAVLAAFQPFGRPDPVEVVHQLAAVERLGRIERLVGRHIGKTHREGSDGRPHARVQQVRRRDHAAELVAVGQRVDQHMRAGPAGVEAMHVVDAGIALAVGREVARHHFEIGLLRAHGNPLRVERSTVQEVERDGVSAVTSAIRFPRPWRPLWPKAINAATR